MGIKKRITKAYSAFKSVAASVRVRDFWQSGINGSVGFFGKASHREAAKQVSQYKSWVFTCASLIAQTSAGVPLNLYVDEGIDEKGKKKYRQLYDHPFLTMWENVNPWMNNFEMVELLSTYLSLTGDAYLYLIDNALGVPAEMWVLPSQKIKIIPGEDFISGYIYTRDDGEKLLFKPHEIVHFKYPNPLDLFYGYSTVYAAKRPINHAEHMDDYEDALFRNMGRPDIGLLPDGELGDEEFARIQEQWGANYIGTSNAGKIIILEGIKDIKTWPTTVSPREIAFLKGRSVVKEEIFSVYHIPLTFADPVHASRANMYNDDMRLGKYAIKPHLTRIQEKIREKILVRYDEKLFCSFDINTILPEDKISRIKEREVNIRVGYSTRDEERAVDGLEPLENRVGSVIYIPVNTHAVETLEEAKTDVSNNSNKNNTEDSTEKGIMTKAEIKTIVHDACLKFKN